MKKFFLILSLLSISTILKCSEIDKPIKKQVIVKENTKKNCPPTCKCNPCKCVNCDC